MSELPRRSNERRCLARRSPLDKKKRLGAPTRTRKGIMEGKLKENAQATRSPSELKKQRGRSDLRGKVTLTATVPCQIPKRGSLPWREVGRISGGLTQ